MRVTYFRTAYVDDTTAEERDLVEQKMNGWASGEGGNCVTRESISEWLEDHKTDEEKTESDIKLAEFLNRLEKEFDDGDIGDVVFSS